MDKLEPLKKIENIKTGKDDKLNLCGVMPSFNSVKNWTEDYEGNFGGYCCKCHKCKEYFYGHKRRFVCKECANIDKG